MISRNTLLCTLSITLLSVLTVTPQTHTNTDLLQERTSKGQWLIIDGTRNFSYAMARLLISRGERFTMVVRPADMMHYDMRFDDKSLIDLVTLDYTKEHSRAKLTAAAAGKQFLYLDPEHDTFLEWHDTLPRITMNALVAARTHKLTVYYAGRVFPMKKDGPITAHTPYAPTEELTEQGKTLRKIEKMIELVTSKKLCKVRTIRTSYPFGPGMYDYLLSTSFKEIPENGRFTWLYTIKKPFQFCYTHDAAHLALTVSHHEKDLGDYECIPFAGYICKSVSEFSENIVRCAGSLKSPVPKINHRTVNRSRLNLVSKFEPNALRGIDLADFFRNPAIIDSSETEKKFGFTATPLDEALTATLLWYATNKDTRGLFVLRDDSDI